MAERKTPTPAERAEMAAAEAEDAARRSAPAEPRDPAEPLSKRESRMVDAEAADQMLSREEQEKVDVGQGRGVDHPGVLDTSGTDPNRALDLPPDRVSGDMKKDAERAYGVSNTGAGDEASGPRRSDRSAHSGPADETAKSE